MESLTLENCY